MQVFVIHPTSYVLVFLWNYPKQHPDAATTPRCRIMHWIPKTCQLLLHLIFQSQDFPLILFCLYVTTTKIIIII